MADHPSTPRTNCSSPVGPGARSGPCPPGMLAPASGPSTRSPVIGSTTLTAPSRRFRSPQLLVTLAIIAAPLAATFAPSSAETPPADIPVTVTATGLTDVVDGQTAH